MGFNLLRLLEQPGQLANPPKFALFGLPHCIKQFKMVLGSLELFSEQGDLYVICVNLAEALQNSSHWIDRALISLVWLADLVFLQHLDFLFELFDDGVLFVDHLQKRLDGLLLLRISVEELLQLGIAGLFDGLIVYEKATLPKMFQLDFEFVKVAVQLVLRDS